MANGSLVAPLRNVGVAVAAAGIGAGLASAIGLPAAPLLGATLGTTLASAARLRPEVPPFLRDFAFVMIGVTLGAISPDVLSDLHHVAGSLVVLTVSMALTVLIAGTVLARVFHTDAVTALLATSPGAMSYALALTTQGFGDARKIVVLQSLRLLVITTCLPPLLGAAAPTEARHAPAVMSLAASVVVLLLGLGLGLLAKRRNVPAGALLAGLAISMPLHVTGLVEGRPALVLTIFGFATAGAVVGTRFSGIAWKDLRALGMASLCVTGLGLAIAALCAEVTAHVLGRPFAEVLVAYAPGGVEAMASMALSLGYDPVFVSAHHIFRILLLFVTLPFVLRRLSRP